MNNKKLSIIIPVYNSKLFLDECLSSIAEEINNDIEVLIIDDGSTDGSDEIYNKYLKDNIIAFKNSNHGVSYARNFGIKKAAGKYLMFVDSDDMLINGWFIKIKEYLNKESNVVYILNNRDKFKDNTEMIECIMYAEDMMASPCCKLFNRDFLLSNNIMFNEKIIIGEDMLFNLTIALKNNLYYICNANIYLYRENLNSSMHSFNPKYYDSNILFLNEITKLLESSKCDRDVINKLIRFNSRKSIFFILDKFGGYSFKEAKLLINELILNKEYVDIIKECDFIRTSKYQRFMLKLLKMRRYRCAIILSKVKFFIKRFIFNLKKLNNNFQLYN